MKWTDAFVLRPYEKKTNNIAISFWNDVNCKLSVGHCTDFRTNLNENLRHAKNCKLFQVSLKSSKWHPTQIFDLKLIHWSLHTKKLFNTISRVSVEIIAMCKWQHLDYFHFFELFLFEFVHVQWKNSKIWNPRKITILTYKYFLR